MNYQFKNLYIDSFAYHLPEDIYTTDQIEADLSETYSRLKLPFGRLELMTGIKARHFWAPGTRPSSQAIIAAKKCLEKENIDSSEIDMLIFTGVCRDQLEPATASAIHCALKLNRGCQFFDLSNACLGFVNAMMIAGQMIENGQIRKALIVSAENSGPLLQQTVNRLKSDQSITRKSIKQYIANLTIGSGAAAMVLSSNPNGPQILGGNHSSRSQAHELCMGGGDIHELQMQTNSEELLKEGVALLKDCWKDAKETINWSDETPKYVVGHQVGVAHEKAVLEAIGLDLRKSFITYDTLGNTGSVALPITLMQLSEQKQINKGDHIALIGVGSGLSAINIGVTW